MNENFNPQAVHTAEPPTTYERIEPLSDSTVDELRRIGEHFRTLAGNIEAELKSVEKPYPFVAQRWAGRYEMAELLAALLAPVHKQGLDVLYKALPVMLPRLSEIIIPTLKDRAKAIVDVEERILMFLGPEGEKDGQ